MIAPVLPCAMRGVIWYQGESNEDTGELYAALFSRMIEDWRKQNGEEHLPFLFVQLPLFGPLEENTETSKWALVREAQWKVLALPHTGMAAALDLGEWNDLHPLNKKEIGFHLALAAARELYHEPNSSPGPLLQRLRHEGDVLFLDFDHCGAGLAAVPACARIGMTVIDGGGKATKLQGEICGPGMVSFDLSSVTYPKKLLYAWADNPVDRQLFNSEGLPAIPFRADIPLPGNACSQ